MKRSTFAACAALLLAACAGTPPAPDAAALRARAAALFGTVEPVRADELATPQAQLGRALFWDTRLSVDGKTACASCHLADDWSADRRPRSINAKGQPTTLHSQPMFMAQQQVALRWYGDRKDGAHQAERSITGSMGYDKATDLPAALKANGYEPQFRAAFPGAAELLTPAQYGLALQAYQRTLRTPAAFDAFLRGDERALTAQQRRGLQAFVDTGCVGCHKGALLGGESMQKFGVVKDYWLATRSPAPDLGRFNATQKDADRYVFRVPMLRNVEKTAPYFHDGSVAKLEDAVRVMADVQLGKTLADGDVADIVAFLGALTGAVPQHYAPPRLEAAR